MNFSDYINFFMNFQNSQQFKQKGSQMRINQKDTQNNYLPKERVNREHSSQHSHQLRKSIKFAADDAKKQSLIEQILLYRANVKSYEKISEQVKNVNLQINTSKKSINLIENTKHIVSQKYNSLTDKTIISQESQINLNNNKKTDKSQRKVSSSKKIKLYELKKKYYRLSKQHNQKNVEYMFCRRQLEVYGQTLRNLLNSISKQENLRQQLKKQHKDTEQSIQGQIEMIKQSQKDLMLTKKRKGVICEQKQQLLRKINGVNTELQCFRKLHQEKNQQQQQKRIKDQEQIGGITKDNNSSKNKNQNRYILEKKQIQQNNYKVIESNSQLLFANDINKNNIQNLSNAITRKDNFLVNNNGSQVIDKKTVTSTLPSNTYQIQNNNNHFIRSHQRQYLFKKPTHQFQNQTNLNSIRKGQNIIDTNKPQINSVQKKLNLQQQFNQQGKSDLVEIHFQEKYSKIVKSQAQHIKQVKRQLSQNRNKKEFLQKINCQLNNQIYQIHQKMLPIQTEIKHHTTNIKLIQSKIHSYQIFLQRENKKYLLNVAAIEQLHGLLSQKQGYCGYVRGQIGTKVNQQTMIKMLNSALKKDLMNFNQKVNSLLICKNLFAQKYLQFAQKNQRHTNLPSKQ